MSESAATQISDLEREFIDELKSEGSLSVHLDDGTEDSYLGYDINPEDVSVIYFEGIGVPRWESLKADNVEEQTAMYWEKFNEKMDHYPLIGRTRDTDEKIEYAADEMAPLAAECERVLGGTSDPKTTRALQKFVIAADKAKQKNSGLRLTPSAPVFF